jgi:hypothetical protein
LFRANVQTDMAKLTVAFRNFILAYKRLTWRTTADRLQVVLCIRCVTDMQLSICFFMQGTMHREKNNLVQHNGKYVYHLLQYATRVLTCLALFSQQTATIWTETAQSAQRVATGWTVRGSNPGGGGHIFRTRPDRPWGLTQRSVQWVPGLSPGLKRPGRVVDHPPRYNAEVKERVELYVYSHSEPSWSVLG